MIDFKIFRASSAELFPNGVLNRRLIIEEGCWYLCTDTAELFVGTQTDKGLALKRVNENEINRLPEDVALKSDVENVKQEVIETVIPEVEAVKAKVESVLLPKVEEEIVPTVEELKAWIDNKEFLQHIDLNGYATEAYVKQAILEADFDNKDIDLTNYVTKAEIAGLASESYVDEKVAGLKVPTKVSELNNDVGYLTAHQDISHLATKDELAEAINGIEHPTVDLTGYVTTETVTQVLENYATIEKVTEVVTQEVTASVEEQVESKVAEVIQDKVDTGEIAVSTNAINYGDF